MLAGAAPFYALDPMSTYENILACKVHTPISFSKVKQRFPSNPNTEARSYTVEGIAHFRAKTFVNIMELLNPKIASEYQFSFCMFLVVYLGQGHPTVAFAPF